MTSHVDFDDPFPMSEGQRAAMELSRRLSEQRTRELSDVMQRVAAGRQTLADIQLLADELGIPLTIVTT